MHSYTLDDIRRTFSNSTDFNEIFDVFQAALAQKVKDVEPYRLLFWNQSLTPDEIRLFYLWLASVFEVTCSGDDNFELAVHYYQKAASIRPAEPDPYLDACDCYDADLNIPPLAGLIEFLRNGVEHVPHPEGLFRRLAHLYEMAGDMERSEYYRRRAEAGESPAQETGSPPA
jgi:hypothetical protein